MLIKIPGEFIALFTFPGVVIHEISHRLLCDIFKVPVFEVNYFNMETERVGFVRHQHTDKLMHNLLIGLAPLFINTVLCMILTFPLSATMYITGEAIPNFFNIVLWWIGFSIGVHAFPSDQDLAYVALIAQERNILVLTWICSGIRFLNSLSQIWINFIYALLISFILPYIIFG